MDSINWDELKAYFERKLENVRRGLEDADGPTMHRLQGKSGLLRELLRLPDLLAGERERAKDSKGGVS